MLNILIWPGIFLFFLLRFESALRDILANLNELSLKGAGFEASMKKEQAAATAALAVAASRSSSGATPESAANAVAAVTPKVIKQARKSTVLWVDDNPAHNIYERQSLEALGINFVLASSTEEALNKIRKQDFDAIISDMARPPDLEAGYTLLDKLRSSGDRTPFLIYAGSQSPEHVAESKRRGAIGYTNRPDELFAMVLSVL
ncbi:MAG TPA: response regulator [Chroococcidiopsis sp.]